MLRYQSRRNEQNGRKDNLDSQRSFLKPQGIHRPNGLHTGHESVDQRGLDVSGHEPGKGKARYQKPREAPGINAHDEQKDHGDIQAEQSPNKAPDSKHGLKPVRQALKLITDIIIHVINTIQGTPPI
jgi:hypothetical protein